MLIDATATFDDNTQFFGTGDLELDTAELGFYPRGTSKTVNLATGEGQHFRVKGTSLLDLRYRDPNSGGTGSANTFIIREPEFGDAGALTFCDRVSAVGSDGASQVKYASGAPAMSASGRVKLPILMSGKQSRFTTYDADAGFMTFTGGVTSVSDCAADKVLYCNSTKTFAANSSYDVEAIYSADWAGITVPSTTTVRIGDAVNPGMVLMSGQNGLTGGGRLDFLGAKAMIVGGGSGSADYNSCCDVKIMNAASVNYLASLDESSSYRKISLSTAQDYVCDTYVSGVRIFAKNASCFSTGSVHLMGGMRKGGQIDFRTEGVWANDFTVRGAGSSNTEWDSATAHWGTAALSFYAAATISGDVEIQEIARLRVAAGVRGEVSGTVSGGRLYLYDNYGEFALEGHNAYTGGTRVDGGRLTLGHADSAGTGVLEFHGGEDGNDPRPVLAFDNSEDVVFTNDVTGSCTLLIAGEGKVKLAGDISGTEIGTMGTYFTRGRHRISADAILPFSSVEEPGTRNRPILVLDEQTTYVIPADAIPGDFEIVLEPGAKVNFVGSSPEHTVGLYRFIGNREDVTGYFTESHPKTGSVLVFQ